MKDGDPIIARIRAARERISERLDNDPSRLLEYCKELHRKFRASRSSRR